MIKRRVKHWYSGEAVVTRWEPLGSAMCDVLVRFDDGREVWCASTDLRPLDGRGPLPSRAAARKAADRKALSSLRVIRAQLVREIVEPGHRWPGAEHGKALVGRGIDAAIAAVEERLGPGEEEP